VSAVDDMEDNIAALRTALDRQPMDDPERQAFAAAINLAEIALGALLTISGALVIISKGRAQS
jgi:hypothetical protein